MNIYEFFKSFCPNWYYKTGTIYSTVGDFDTYKSSGTSISLSKLAGYMEVVLSAATAWIYGTTQIDVTNIETLWIRVTNSHPTAAMQLNLHTSYTSTGATAYSWISGGTTNEWVSLDVSGLSGSYYLRVGRFDSTVSTTITVYEIYGV